MMKLKAVVLKLGVYQNHPEYLVKPRAPPSVSNSVGLRLHF